MTLEPTSDFLHSLVQELIKLPQETEWVEFKVNNDRPDSIGEYISALANSAALFGKQSGYLIWGIRNEDHAIVGTSFKPAQSKVGNELLENWLLKLLTPKPHFRFYELVYNEKPIVILEIPRAVHNPVQFKNEEYLRIGSYIKHLKDFPDKERAFWRVFEQLPFERQFAAQALSADTVLKQLDYPAFFDLTGIPLPENRDGILARLSDEGMIQKESSGLWSITNLGAVLFARKLQDFHHLARKAVRLILYKGNGRIETIREMEGGKGYAVGFKHLIAAINTFLPKNEIIGQALRKDVLMYPELAIRELVANALIHQDLTVSGTGPKVEIFADRMEITNPGIPLMDTLRFLDTPPRSRNEALASFLRRVGICEERGSGIDKVVFQTEFYQLPAPLIEVAPEHTRVVLFAHRDFKDMDKEDRIRACYLHCCLRFVNREVMNSTSLRQRFRIEEQNKAQVSRIIKQTMDTGLIRLYDAETGVRSKRYVPFWS